jgi:DNA-binding LytR/AlgR family response regulator
MLKILRQPFPRERSFKRQFFNAIISGLIVVIFLRIFQPFGFSFAPVSNLNLFALGFGIVTTIIVMFFVFFEFAFPAIFSEEKWTVGKNILVYIVVVFLIGAANLFYTSVTTGLEISIETFLRFQLITLSVTFIVVSAMTLIKYFRSLDFYKKDAEKADEEVHQLKPSDNKELIILKSENGKENLELQLNELIYIEAADNYSKIIYRKDNKINTTLIRSSLKRLEEQFSQPELFRCHRTFIVQLRNVERVSGNSQGYRLHLKHLQQSIPVSRKFGQDVHNRISRLVN